MSEENQVNQENNQELNINPDRSRFSKLDNKRKNLHSEDVDRQELAEGDPGPDFKDRDRLQDEPWKKQ